MVVSTTVIVPVIVCCCCSLSPWLLVLLGGAGVLTMPVMLSVILPVFAAIFAAVFLAVIVAVVAVATMAAARLTSGDLRQGAKPANHAGGGDEASPLEAVGPLNFGFCLVHDALP